MATILDLFKEQNKDIYGLAGKVFIESKGVINPGRAAALAASSPNAVVGMVGNQVAGLIKGSANRPSDTIFKSNKPFAKPVSLTDGINPNTIDGNKKDYFVKTSPSPLNNLNINNAISAPVSTAVNLAKDGLRRGFASKDGIDKIKSAFKKPTDKGGYGTIYQQTVGDKVVNETRKFTTHAPVYTKNTDKNGNESYRQSELKERQNKNTFDLVNRELLTIAMSDENDGKTFEDKNAKLNIAYVMLQFYDSSEKIFLPGTISGLSEDFSPEWNGFKYVGSPFNVYRYGGVERSIKFDVKLYYTDAETKAAMINNLNKIRRTVYPNKELISIEYTNSTYSPLVFKPNFVYLTINGLYQNLFGLIDSLSFSIDDTTPWPVMGEDMDTINQKPHPVVINVSLGFRVIENHKIEDKKLIYNFEGRTRGDVSAGGTEKVGNL